MALRVAVTGANSAVGVALLRLQPPEIHEETSFVACVRSERAERQLPELYGAASRVARIQYDEPNSLAGALAGCDAVIHLPGVLIERRDSSYERANVETTRALVRAAAASGVSKIVLVSAVGADPDARNRYYRSKGSAERLVRESGSAYTILRVPLLIGRGTEGSAALLRRARAGRAHLLGGGRHRQQPLDVEDLARVCLKAAEPCKAKGRTLDLVGPEVLTEREMLERTARALGREIRIYGIPVGAAKFAAAVRAKILRGGFSPDAIEVITDDTNLVGGAEKELGIELRPLDATIQRMKEELERS